MTPDIGDMVLKHHEEIAVLQSEGKRNCSDIRSLFARVRNLELSRLAVPGISAAGGGTVAAIVIELIKLYWS